MLFNPFCVFDVVKGIQDEIRHFQLDLKMFYVILKRNSINTISNNVARFVINFCFLSFIYFILVG